jgi:TetR/AcrR family transcriptional regulator
MGVQKKSKPREKNEATILCAAEDVFAELGFAGATTALIAKRAGIPKANLHYYFPTKEALYRGIINNILMTWFGASRNFDDCDDPTDALTRYIKAKMQISRDHPLASKIWAQEVIHGSPQTQDFLETTLQNWTVSREKIIERWIAEGKITPINPRYLLYMIWATTQHYADFGHQIVTLNGGQALSDEQYDEATLSVTNIILRGIGLKAIKAD